MKLIHSILKLASGKLKSSLSRRASKATLFSSTSSSLKLCEDELIFEEMDLVLREEINRLEQALTDYLQAQIGGRINGQVEDRYITRITELYEKWAYLSPPQYLSCSASSASIYSGSDANLQKKAKELKLRRKKIDDSIERRKQSWKKLSPKKVIVEFEDGILLGNGYDSQVPRVFRYTLITVHKRWSP